MDGGSVVMRDVIRKGKVNGFEASDALAMSRTIILYVVHVMHR